MMKKNEQIKGLIQICILIISIFAFAYIIHETNYSENILIIEKKRGFLSLLPSVLKFVIKIIFSEKNLVSALEASDLDPETGGVWTCAKAKDGSICQEYPASECNANCNGECFPSSRDNTPGCKLGTCFDEEIGTCNERSPQNQCEKNKGKWLDDPAGNVAECQKGCCVVGDQTIPLVSARACEYLQETEGIETEFRPDIRNELSCLALAKEKTEGACVFNTNGEKTCRFLNAEECNVNGGEFNEGILCTHPSLEMGYEKQATARCAEGKDELYWFDSEGNRENVYDANKVKSWNKGEVLTESESCELGNSRDAFSNQKTCGNCNRFLGSVCGTKTADEKLSDGSIDFVCKDLRCKDSNGNERENGESWCEYQGAIGLQEGIESPRSEGKIFRSADTPGSRHFRASCIDGEVQIQGCADYRNQICVEEQNKRENDNEIISSAACVTNLWQMCITYNTEIKGEDKDTIVASIAERDKKCNDNPLCHLKQVDLSEGFDFDTCVPKYPPGFDLQKNAEGGELSCALGTRECTVYYVKKISGWDCVANCQCEKKIFAEQMNDLCISLGDCGASVNYMGDLTENYRTTKERKKLDGDYLNGIKKYSDSKGGEFVELNVSAYYEAIGGISIEDPTAESLSNGGTIAGLSGTVLLYASSTNFATTTPFLLNAGGSASLAAVLTTLAVAAIAFALTALLIQITGIGGGLEPYMINSLLAGATSGAALIAASYTGASAAAAGGLGAGVAAAATIAAIVTIVGIVLLAVAVIIIVVLYAIGVGDTKKRVIEFECQPWQPVLGGAKCEECGSDGYPCSPYSCQSLGQTCRLINEGTAEEKCVDISPNDVSAPIISSLKDVLTQGFKYEDESAKGMKIVSNENDGCLKSNEPIIFGIELNEPGYCRYDFEHKGNFDEMGFDLGSRNLFLEKHAQFLTVPDLTSLGIPGYDPTRRAELNFYIRCIDGNGNSKDSAEFVINMCIKPGKDVSPPTVTGREPFREEVAFNAKELQGSIFVNEPATCKWSLQDKDYELMENEFECEKDVIDRTSLRGWKCTDLFETKKDENKFYVRCKDQPWYGENWKGEGVDLAGEDNIEPDESKRNAMLESYEFNVKKTKTSLNIDSVVPNNKTLVFGVQPATVILEVKTSGGIDGKATCRIFGNEMGETFRDKHKQIFDRIFAGHYEFPIECIDLAGNSATGLSVFDVELDVSPPTVTRVYKQGSNLIVVTNEEAECAYVNGVNRKDLCNFDFVNGTLMSGTEKRHNSEFGSEQDYYIKCKDKWNNVAGDCSIIVRGGYNEA